MNNSTFTESQFWELIENAWEQFEVPNQIRQQIVKEGGTPKTLPAASQALNELVIPVIETKLKSFSKEDLIAFDQILERKLYNIDREEVQYYIEGGDDLFLYKRGFIVGMGKAYYDQINANPVVATQDKFSWYITGGIDCQSMCFVATIIFYDTYDDYMPDTGISRESCSNRDHWPEDF